MHEARLTGSAHSMQDWGCVAAQSFEVGVGYWMHGHSKHSLAWELVLNEARDQGDYQNHRSQEPDYQSKYCSAHTVFGLVGLTTLLNIKNCDY